MCSEQFCERINHKLVLREKFSVPLFGFVANGFNNFYVKFRIPGNERPKSLTT
jgi:hypothetical protein